MLKKAKLNLVVALAAMIGLHLSGAANGQTFPSKLVTIIVPFGAGGSTDITARIMAKKLEELTGQPFIVENKPGATGVIGTNAAKQAAADGYTWLLASSSTMAANPHMYKKLSYDPATDFTPVAINGASGNFLLVNKDAPYKTLKEFIAYAKTSKEKLFAAYGNATSRVPAALLASKGGLQFEEVAYKDAVASLQDLIAGRVDLVMPDMVVGESYVRGGQVRALAVTTPDRVAAYQDIPTIAEELPGYQLLSFSGWAVRSEVPENIKVRINQLLNQTIASPEVKEKLENLGLITVQWDIKKATEFVNKERELWAEYVRIAKIEVQ